MTVFGESKFYSHSMSTTSSAQLRRIQGQYEATLAHSIVLSFFQRPPCIMGIENLPCKTPTWTKPLPWLTRRGPPESPSSVVVALPTLASTHTASVNIGLKEDTHASEVTADLSSCQVVKSQYYKVRKVKILCTLHCSRNTCTCTSKCTHWHFFVFRLPVFKVPPLRCSVSP